MQRARRDPRVWYSDALCGEPEKPVEPNWRPLSVRESRVHFEPSIDLGSDALCGEPEKPVEPNWRPLSVRESRVHFEPSISGYTGFRPESR